jgi:hypothetical protein
MNNKNNFFLKKIVFKKFILNKINNFKNMVKNLDIKFKKKNYWS